MLGKNNQIIPLSGCLWPQGHKHVLAPKTFKRHYSFYLSFPFCCVNENTFHNVVENVTTLSLPACGFLVLLNFVIIRYAIISNKLNIQEINLNPV